MENTVRLMLHHSTYLLALSANSDIFQASSSYVQIRRDHFSLLISSIMNTSVLLQMLSFWMESVFLIFKFQMVPVSSINLYTFKHTNMPTALPAPLFQAISKHLRIPTSDTVTNNSWLTSLLGGVEDLNSITDNTYQHNMVAKISGCSVLLHWLWRAVYMFGQQPSHSAKAPRFLKSIQLTLSRPLEWRDAKSFQMAKTYFKNLSQAINKWHSARIDNFIANFPSRRITKMLHA